MPKPPDDTLPMEKKSFKEGPPMDVFDYQYEVEKIAGVGGMSTVYRGRDRHSGTIVAIKVLREADPKDRIRFEQEAAVLSKLDHPGIVGYVAHGTTPDNEMFMITDWLVGDSLEKILKQGPLSITDTLTLARRLAETLAFIHRLGLVHRDIKPSNLIVDSEDYANAILLDFGIVRPLASQNRLTKTGVMLGTPGYMTPEQARGETTITPSADIFSIGCVLFHCLTGRGPFEAEHDVAVLIRILMEDIPHISALNEEIPEPLDALLYRMMSREPEDRPADGDALLEELDKLVLPTGTPTESPLTTTQPVAELAPQFAAAILLAAEPLWSSRDGATLSNLQIERIIAPMQLLAARYDVKLERLPHGALVGLMTSVTRRREHPFAVARCALALHTMLPDCGLAMVVRRGQDDPVSEAVNAAVLGLSESQSTAMVADAETAQLLTERFEIVGRGPWRQIVGPLPQTWPPMLNGAPMTVVGRQTTLNLLGQLYLTCVSTKVTRIASITANAGMGKSTVAREFLRTWSEPGNVILQAICDQNTRDVPYHLLKSLIRRYWQIRDDDPLAVQQKSVESRLAELLPISEVGHAAQSFGELIGVPFEAGADTINLQETRKQIRLAFIGWLKALATASPVVLVLDELQWADRPSMQLLDAALQQLITTPLFVLSLSEPAVHKRFSNLWSGHLMAKIPLDPLPVGARRRLVARHLSHLIDDERAAQLVEYSGGNPLFLEELIRRELAAPDSPMPLDITDALNSRLKRLDSESRHALRAASVFGVTFWTDGTQTLLGNAGSELDFDDLTRAELIEPAEWSKFSDQSAYRFCHYYIRDALYRSVGMRARILGHCLAGTWLKEMGESEPLVLAEHFVSGGASRDAVTFFHEAAEIAWLAEDWQVVKYAGSQAIKYGASGGIQQRCEFLVKMAEKVERQK